MNVSWVESIRQELEVGNKQLAKKRERALIQDEKMRRERNAQWVRNVEGVRLVRKGAIKTA